MKKIPQTRWINTRTVWEWDGKRYVKVEEQGNWYTGPVAEAGGGSANTGLDAARFYETDNSTTVALQDADPVSLNVDTTYVWRVRIYNSGTKDENSTTFNLEANNTTQTTGWFSVTGASTHVQTADASGLTNGNTVTSGTLTGASGTFQNGEEVEDGVSGSITLAQAFYTEIWYSFTIVSGNVNNNDNIDFRVTMGGTTLDFDNVNQSVTVVEANTTDVTATTAATTASADVRFLRISDIAAQTAATTASADAAIVLGKTASVDATTAATTSASGARFAQTASVNATTAAVTADVDIFKGRVTQFTPAFLGPAYGAFAPKSGGATTTSVDATTGAATGLATARFARISDIAASVAAVTGAGTVRFAPVASVSATIAAITATANATAVRVASTDANLSAITATANAIAFRIASVDANTGPTSANASVGGARNASVTATTSAVTASASTNLIRVASVDATQGATTASSAGFVTHIASVDSTTGSVTASGDLQAATPVVTGKTPAGGITGSGRYEYRKKLNQKTYQSNVAAVANVVCSAKATVITKRTSQSITYEPDLYMPEFPEKQVRIVNCRVGAIAPSVIASTNSKHTKFEDLITRIELPFYTENIRNINVKGKFTDKEMVEILTRVLENV